jgi:hypothetical protein
LDQPGGSASAAIADTNAGTGRGGSIAGAGFACRIVTGASARPDAASRRLALPGPGQIGPRHSDPARTELRRGDATGGGIFAYCMAHAPKTPRRQL